MYKVGTMLCTGLVATLALAQSTAPPADLKRDARDLTADLEMIRVAHDLPSIAAAAYRDGRLIGVGAAGWYSVNHATPVSPTSRYHIGSCSKAMTAVVLGSVIEDAEGLDWDTTLPEALPAYADFIHADYSHTTIRDLLGHRSGLIESRTPAIVSLGWTITERFGDDDLITQRNELLKAALSVAPAAEPGTEFGYSNFAYIIAATIAETHAGKSFEDLLRERIFESLGMTTAGFGPPGAPGEVVEPLGHSKHDEWMPAALNDQGIAIDNPPVFNSAGRVHASVIDWCRFVGDFEQGLDGSGLLLDTETYLEIATDLEGDAYALGWGVAPRAWAGDAPALAHTGSNTFWFSVAWIGPDNDLAMVAVVNAATSEAQRAADEAIQVMIEKFASTRE